MSAARPDRGYPQSQEDWSCPTCAQSSQLPCRTRDGDKVLPHLRRLLLPRWGGWSSGRPPGRPRMTGCVRPGRCWKAAAELLDAGDLPDLLRSGERASWPLTPDQVLELVEVQELLQVLPVVRRRRRHAELLAPPG